MIAPKRSSKPFAMADKKSKQPDRLNRTVSLGEVASRALDPVLRQRGFATAELVANWQSIVPAPYDRSVLPDRLKWNRKAENAAPDGATLYVRVDPVQALGFAHEHARIRDAINRYFGFFLVADIRTAREPFVPRTARHADHATGPTPADLAAAGEKVAAVSDAGVRAALARLGAGVAARKSGRSR
jgi:hypothetical protein